MASRVVVSVIAASCMGWALQACEGEVGGPSIVYDYGEGGPTYYDVFGNPVAGVYDAMGNPVGPAYSGPLYDAMGQPVYDVNGNQATATGTGGTGGVTAGTGATGGGTGATGGGTGGVVGSGGDDGSGGVMPIEDLEPFSFFVTSLETMRAQSGSQDGFGGNFGGLTGADEICRKAADDVGFGAKTWRAFLSATDDGSGQPVNAIDRIGQGPWYDRNGRLIAEDLQGLMGDRPDGDAQAVNDLPNELGQGLQAMGDTHDIITGSNAEGQLDSDDPANTCNDWTSIDVMPVGGGFTFPPSPGGNPGGLRVGHSWPAMSGTNWKNAHAETSCRPGVNLVQDGPGDGSSVGAGGGWGGFYCFALQP